MSQQTNKPALELLNTQLNVNDNHKENSSKDLIVEGREPIEGTPFTLAKTARGYTLLMGLYALTPTFKTKKQLTEFRNKNEWNIIVNVLHAMLDFHKIINKEQK